MENIDTAFLIAGVIVFLLVLGWIGLALYYAMTGSPDDPVKTDPHQYSDETDRWPQFPPKQPDSIQ